MLPVEAQNFLSVDQKSARNSYGAFFTIGETVGHQGYEETAVIQRFSPREENNEVLVYTDKGTANLDFLVKVDPPEKAA